LEFRKGQKTKETKKHPDDRVVGGNSKEKKKSSRLHSESKTGEPLGKQKLGGRRGQKQLDAETEETNAPCTTIHLPDEKEGLGGGPKHVPMPKNERSRNKNSLKEK